MLVPFLVALSPLSCSSPSVLGPLCAQVLPMDSDWYSRLIDERRGLCFLSEYCRALRLLSGLSQVGSLRARQEASAHGIEREFRDGVLSEAPVRAFMDFLSEFTAQELPVVFEVIRQQLYPDSSSRCLFRAAQMDPRTDPVGALRAASTDLRELEQILGPTLPGPSDWPVTRPKTDRSLQVEEVLTAVTALPCSACPILPSSVAGVFGPSCFGAVSHFPDLPRVQAPPLRHLGLYVAFRGEYIATKLVDLKPRSTAKELLEAVWPSVVRTAKETREPVHHGLLVLPGSRIKLSPDAVFADILSETEALLEANFSIHEHALSVPFHVDQGRIDANTRGEKDKDPASSCPGHPNFRTCDW